MTDQPPENHTPQPDAAPPARTWWVVHQGRVYGPAEAATIRRWAAEGRIRPGFMVRETEGEPWRSPKEVPELRDALLLVPPPPTQAWTHSVRSPVGQVVCACPHCGGPVTNMAPVYGWPWGLWQRTFKPEFVCATCGRDLQPEELPPAVRQRLAGSQATARVVWGLLVIALALAIALPFIVVFAGR